MNVLIIVAYFFAATGLFYWIIRKKNFRLVDRLAYSSGVIAFTTFPFFMNIGMPMDKLANILLGYIFLTVMYASYVASER